MSQIPERLLVQAHLDAKAPAPLSDAEKADAFGRLDFRLTYTSPDSSFLVSAFVNNILDEVGVLQVLRQGEEEFFRHTAGTTVPRMYGLEVTYNMGGS